MQAMAKIDSEQAGEIKRLNFEEFIESIRIA